MNTTFKTPSGDEMVILPRAEYERLVAAHDMSVDIAIYDRFYERLARGEEELIRDSGSPARRREQGNSVALESRADIARTGRKDRP